jgi:hypothetical protein
MTAMKIPCEGGCRCERLRFKISAPPLLTMACHCRGCQKMTASAFSLSVAIPTQGFAIIKGEPIVGGMHGAAHHLFCPHCFSWAFTRMEGMDAFVNVRATLLDDAAWYAPFIETQTLEKLPWATVPARHSFERFPAFEAFPALIEEYAARGRST